MCFPCAGHCQHCGEHINPYFNVDQSESKYMLTCGVDKDCNCVGDKCSFNQGYGEGSSYEGFMVTDTVYFGDDYHREDDGFAFNFGCVTTETHLFYTQKADGILGLTKSSSQKNMRPIYDVMKEKGVIEKKEFSLCLGKDGGYF